MPIASWASVYVPEAIFVNYVLRVRVGVGVACSRLYRCLGVRAAFHVHARFTRGGSKFPFRVI